MPYKVRLFLRKGEHVHTTSVINSPTPQIANRVRVPVGVLQIDAPVIGAFRTQHSEEIDLIDVYEDETPQTIS